MSDSDEAKAGKKDDDRVVVGGFIFSITEFQDEARVTIELKFSGGDSIRFVEGGSLRRVEVSEYLRNLAPSDYIEVTMRWVDDFELEGPDSWFIEPSPKG
jgi:hypothetical protein